MIATAVRNASEANWGSRRSAQIATEGAEHEDRHAAKPTGTDRDGDGETSTTEPSRSSRSCFRRQPCPPGAARPVGAGDRIESSLGGLVEKLGGHDERHVAEGLGEVAE